MQQAGLIGTFEESRPKHGTDSHRGADDLTCDGGLFGEQSVAVRQPSTCYITTQGFFSVISVPCVEIIFASSDSGSVKPKSLNHGGHRGTRRSATEQIEASVFFPCETLCPLWLMFLPSPIPEGCA